MRHLRRRKALTRGAVRAALALSLMPAAPALAEPGVAAEMTGDACPLLVGAAGTTLISISGKDFEGRAALAADSRTVAIGEPDGRCIVFATLDPDALVRPGEMNVVASPETPPPANTRAPLLLAAVLDPPLEAFLASRGTLHVSDSEDTRSATFRLELHHGEVSFTVLGRFAVPRPD